MSTFKNRMGRIHRIKDVRETGNAAGGNMPLKAAIAIDDLYVNSFDLNNYVAPLADWERELLLAGPKNTIEKVELPYAVKQNGSTIARFYTQKDAAEFLWYKLDNAMIGTRFEVSHDA